MKALKTNDLVTFESLAKATQKELKNSLSMYLHRIYSQVIETDVYLCAVGDIPIALVAHLDTVFPSPPKDIYYDREKNVMWSPNGLGADDRAGVFAILKILKTGRRPHIIFTTDEEKGGVGASVLALKYKEPFANMKYIIELDRQGTSDCVFYSCENPKFTEYIEAFGFVEAIGTYSDISEICPVWGVAGVNLSIGYMNEHSVAETLHIAAMMRTIDRVCKMLDDVVNVQEVFQYIPSKYRFAFNREWYMSMAAAATASITCDKCNADFSEYEVFPVKDKNGFTQFRCPDCIADGTIQWCSVCAEACEVPHRYDYGTFICEDCKKGSVTPKHHVHNNKAAIL